MSHPIAFRRHAAFRATLAALAVALLGAGPAAAQVDSVVTADLVTWTQQRVSMLPGAGSFGYTVPDSLERSRFKTAVNYLLAGNLHWARSYAHIVNYNLVELRDSGNNNETIYALWPTSGLDFGRGYYFVRPESQIERKLILEAPHPIADHDTAKLAAEAFRASGARAFAFAGAHRCASRGSTAASSQYSPCSGTTTVCHPSGASEPYVVSDMAHNVTSFFQAFHEAVSDEDTENVIVQPHALGSTYEYSISDGRSNNLSGTTYLSNAFVHELDTSLPSSAPDGNGCNRVGDANYKCGTTNVQGRYTNATGSTSGICTSASGTTNSGRFLHTELAWDIRHSGGTLTPQMYVAVLLDVIPTIPGSNPPTDPEQCCTADDIFAIAPTCYQIYGESFDVCASCTSSGGCRTSCTNVVLGCP